MPTQYAKATQSLQTSGMELHASGCGDDDGCGNGDGDGDGNGDGKAMHGPQSAQSVHGKHREYSEPSPPSSQKPSVAWEHVSAHDVGAGGDGKKQ